MTVFGDVYIDVIKLNEAIRVSPEPVGGELWTHRDTRDAHTQGRPCEEAERGQHLQARRNQPSQHTLILGISLQDMRK